MARQFRNEEYERRLLEILQRMEDFLTTTGCRRHLILSYFDPKLAAPETPQEDCCDNCTRQLRSSGSSKAPSVTSSSADSRTTTTTSTATTTTATEGQRRQREQ